MGTLLAVTILTYAPSSCRRYNLVQTYGYTWGKQIHNGLLIGETGNTHGYTYGYTYGCTYGYTYVYTYG